MKMFPEKELSGPCPVCGKDLQDQNNAFQLPVGTILAGRYYIGKVIGQGGFGITYTGCDLKLGLKVAVKEYYPQGLVGRIAAYSTYLTVNPGNERTVFETQKKRFLDEARILAEFTGDSHVVRVSDLFEENNTSYIVMEYIEGETLEAFRKRCGVLTFDSVYEMLGPIMLTLSAIHAKGLIHRDISPANLMVKTNREVKLIDFGSARDYDVNEERSLSIILKPGYAPPEQYNTHGTQGPWSDVYALCATIYRCITGRIPDNSFERMTNDTLPYPSDLGAVITREQEAVLLCGLAPQAEQRFQTMNELHDAFQAAGSGIITEKARSFYRGKKPVIDRLREKKENREDPSSGSRPSSPPSGSHPSGFSSEKPASSAASGTASGSGGSGTRAGSGINGVPGTNGGSGTDGGTHFPLAVIGGGAAVLLIAVIILSVLKPWKLIDTGSAGSSPESVESASVQESAGNASVQESAGNASVQEKPDTAGEDEETAGETTAAAEEEEDAGETTAAAEEEDAGETTAAAEEEASSSKEETSSSTKEETAEVIDWKDSKLEEAMQKTTGIRDRGLTAEDVEEMTSLDLRDSEIRDISALSTMDQLEELYLSGNQLSDISPLAELSNLTTLDLADTDISDVSSLADLTGLTSLVLTGNRISDISPLKKMTKLTSLFLKDNKVTDVSPLKGLTSLRSLYLGNNQISDVTPLAEMTWLEHLYLNGNPVRDYLPLQALGLPAESTDIGDHISAVDWKDSNLESALREVAGVTGRQLTYADIADLKELVLEGKGIKDISALSNLTGLTKLSLKDNEISDISALSGLKNLKSLTLSKNKITDAQALRELTQLQALALSDNPLEDLYDITDLTNLTTLRADRTGEDSLYCIRDLTNLKVLSMAGNNITYIGDYFTNLKQLKTLSLDNNQIERLKGLSYLSNLTALSLRNNNISDVSEIAELKGLEDLYLSGNSIRDYSPLRELTIGKDHTDVPIPLNGQGADFNYNFKDIDSDINFSSEKEEVRKLQDRLIKLGYLDGTADGAFGPKTQDAVRRFQDKNGIANGAGIATTFTQAVLNSDEAIPASDSYSREITADGRNSVRTDYRVTFTGNKATVSASLTNYCDLPIRSVRIQFWTETNSSTYSYGWQIMSLNSLKRSEQADIGLELDLDSDRKQSLLSIHWFVSEIAYTNGEVWVACDPTRELEEMSTSNYTARVT